MALMPVMLGMESLVFFVVGCLKKGDIKYPVILFNLVWIIVSVLMFLNPMGWYEISEKPYLVAIIGSLFFNYGGLVLDKVVIKRGGLRQRESEYENIKGNRLLLIQIVLLIVTIPMLLKAFAFLKIYGWHDMRFIYGNGIKYGYMTAFDRIFYVHIVVFPLMQACFYIQTVLFVKGKIPLWHLLVGIIDIVCTIIITVGRWDIVYIIIAMFFSLKFRQDKIVFNLSKKAKKRIYFLAGLMLVVVVYVTLNRHNATGGILNTLIDVLAGYFCCGLQLLDQMFKNVSQSGLNTYSFGGAICSGLFTDINVILMILTGSRIQIPIVDVSSYSGNFFQVGYGKTMNAYVTWYYYFLRDFGIIGVMVISALLGIVSVNIYKKAVKYPSTKNQVIYLHMVTILLFCSLWWEPIRMEVVAKLLHNIWLIPFIGIGRPHFSFSRKEV